MAFDDYDDDFGYGDGDSYDPELVVEYYLFDRSVARLWYDAETEQYIDGEILDRDGEWEKCPVHDVLSEGREVSSEEAAKRARALGATV